MATTEITVRVDLSTTITQGEENETISFTTFGRYYEKAGSAYLRYDEVLEEGTVKTTVKLSNEQGLILRGGAVKMRLAFNREDRMNGSYESPHGTFLLQTHTKELSHTETAEGEGTLRIRYELRMQGSSVGNYDMKITYKEELNQ
ncbi:DUF1934 domain-containing protein [Bacillus coahuilensis]|uniref:DUF1934 domain-containing protein n=1 Tax=Bacillus coahuilensis TaxID=408580 RepID=UPI0007519063|nr:DUF1934 domain-containing protein [Bacillus coahuilensis]